MTEKSSKNGAASPRELDNQSINTDVNNDNKEVHLDSDENNTNGVIVGQNTIHNSTIHQNLRKEL